MYKPNINKLNYIFSPHDINYINLGSEFTFTIGDLLLKLYLMELKLILFESYIP